MHVKQDLPEPLANRGNLWEKLSEGCSFDFFSLQFFCLLQVVEKCGSGGGPDELWSLNIKTTRDSSGLHPSWWQKSCSSCGCHMIHESLGHKGVSMVAQVMETAPVTAQVTVLERLDFALASLQEGLSSLWSFRSDTWSYLLCVSCREPGLPSLVYTDPAVPF